MLDAQIISIDCSKKGFLEKGRMAAQVSLGFSQKSERQKVSHWSSNFASLCVTRISDLHGDIGHGKAAARDSLLS